MATEIVLPKFGNTVEECIIGQWHKSIGDAVAVDEVLCGVETDKTTMDVVSTADGVLRHLFYAAGEVVPVMRVIAIVAAADEDIDALLATHGGAGDVADTASDAGGSAQQRADAADHGAAPHHVADHDAKHAVSAHSHTATAATPLTFTPRAQLYLQKKQLTAAQFMRHFAIDGLWRGSRSVVEEKEVQAFFERLAPLSPHALQTLIAQDKLLTIANGSGIGGRILARDIAALGARPAPTDAAQRSVPIAGMRKIIAERMMQSLQSTAQVTLIAQADARGIRRARAQYKQRGLAITINDIILYIVSRTLSDSPWANSLLVDGMLIEYAQVHLGCAVQTERGLMVPVIANASHKSIHDISAEMKRLSQRCKTGDISPDELQGGTFTVTNLGALGVQSFTPVLNVPQTGILGIGGIDIRAVETADGEIVFRHCLNLSLTFDHRAYDGADGALLLRSFATAIAEVDDKHLEPS